MVSITQDALRRQRPRDLCEVANRGVRHFAEYWVLRNPRSRLFPLLWEAGWPAGKATWQWNLRRSLGDMSAAAHSPPVDHTSDWLEELEGILKRFDAISNCAQGAVRSVIESFLEDKDTTEDEIVCVAALLARHTPRPEETRQERLPTLVYQRTRQARPTAVALSQGTN